MIYGLGTGRCGTRALAEYLGGVHEPEPWFGPESVAAYWGDAAAHAVCRARLAARAAPRVPIVVDLHQSWLVPQICAIDADAAFVWLIRDPLCCIGSFLAGGAWTERDAYGAALWAPRGGWPADSSRLDKAVTYWLDVNRVIETALARSGRPWRRRRTEGLPVRANVYPVQYQYTPADAACVRALVARPWRRWQDEAESL